MGERSYLSIGDVLALLRVEFPDVTISKIRFLESRGLLDPERTPSGYRKFCPPDVERLRWILRQQRENFLPLKVIKGRLEGGVVADEPAADEQLGEDDVATPLPAGDIVEPLVAVVHEFVGAAANGPSERPPAAAGAKSSSRRSVARAGDSGRGGVSTEGGDGDAGRADAGAAGTAGARHAGAGDPGGGSAGEGGGGVATAASVSAAGEAEEGAPAGDADLSAEPEAAEVATTGKAEDLGASGVSLTTAELAEAAGVSSEEIDALVDYGLIEGRNVAGVTCFDEESLIISRLAVGFARYGLEPRHLRIFKHAAEREAGLFAQVVTGMFRQRNPEARRRAYEALDELSELGRGIHAALLRVALRDLTGG